MFAVEQPSSIWNSGCFDWTCSAHISLRSGMPKHAKIVPITVGRLNSHEPHKQVLVPIRGGTFVQISFSELLPPYLRAPGSTQKGAIGNQRTNTRENHLPAQAQLR
jgi:hypothetical protein